MPRTYRVSWSGEEYAVNCVIEPPRWRKYLADPVCWFIYYLVPPLRRYNPGLSEWAYTEHYLARIPVDLETAKKVGNKHFIEWIEGVRRPEEEKNC